MKKKFNIIALIIIIILCTAITTKYLQNDTFYTIKIGQLILHNGIDMMDHFSWHSIAYTYPHWLYDTIIYLIYSSFGYTGIYVSTIGFFIILASLFYYTCNKITKNQFLSLFMTIMVVFGMKAYVTARAQLVTYILFIVQFLFMESFLKKGNKKYLIGLLIISLLICNMHCAVWPFYFIMYLPFIAEYIVFCLNKSKNKVIKKIKDNKIVNFITRNMSKKISIEKSNNYKYLIYTMLFSILTGLLTPIGDTPYTYFIKTALGNSQGYIDEHMAIVFYKNPLVMTVLAELLIVFSLTKIKIKLRDLCMLCGLVIMALISGRHIALLIIIGFISITRILNSFLLDVEEKITPKIVKYLTKPIIAIIFIIAISLPSALIFKTNFKQDYVDKSLYPVEAVKYIKENVDISNMRLYNDYNYGSYLLLNDIPVYIDSRADLYTKQFSGLDYDIFDDYMNVFSNLDYYMDFYDITHVIGWKDKTLGNTVLYRNNYEVLYQDEYFVFAKRIK